MRCLGWRGTGNEITKKKDEMCAVEKKKEVGNKKKEKRKEKTKGGEKIGNKEKYII
jgi:hypothetical protein